MNSAVNTTLKFGLTGALGCLLAALAGELFLAKARKLIPQAEARVPSRTVCLLIDCSGSMGKNGKLDEVKTAAVEFARRQDLDRDSIAVVGFGSDSRIGISATHNLARVEDAIADLWEGGTTAMGVALASAMEQLENTTKERSILLFTDGVPDYQKPTLEQAAECRLAGIRIVAVATGDANLKFLRRVTGDDSLVFMTQSGSFGEAFQDAEKVIYRAPILVESAEFTADIPPEQVVTSILIIGAWTAILSLGIAFALIVTQNRQFHRRLLSMRQTCIALPGSIIAGFVSGSAGQYLFLQTTRYPELELAGRYAGWILLGAVLGRGMAYIVPNLPKYKATMAGAAGGALGAAGFLNITKHLQTVAEWGDVPARLVGAAGLGLSIGLMIALGDAVFRDAWLEVNYDNKKTERVTLGKVPVSIGSDDGQCTIYTRGVDPVVCSYRFDNGAILCEELATHRTEAVVAGATRTVGKVKVKVCTSGSR